MKPYVKWNSLILSLLPSLGFAISTGAYVDAGTGVSGGPSYVVAPSAGFANSGNTLTGGVTDVFGLSTLGVAGAFVDVGYNVTRNLGIEANFTYWGEQDLSTFTGQITKATGGFSGNLTSYSFGGSVVAYLPLKEEQINLFGKVGIAGLNSELEVNDPGSAIFFNPGSYEQEGTHAAIIYSVGVLYQFKPNLSALVAWNGITQFDNSPISNLQYNMASFGVRYAFGQVAPVGYEK